MLISITTLSFLFFGKRQGNPQKKQGFLIPTEPLKSLEKKGKTLKKKQGIPRKEKKTRNSKKKQGKEGQGSKELPFDSANSKWQVVKLDRVPLAESREGLNLWGAQIVLVASVRQMFAPLRCSGNRKRFLQNRRSFSAAPQQSEICVKFSVSRTVFDVNFWWNFPSHTQTLENVARKISPKFHAKFHDTFGREKQRLFSLPHFCRVAALTILRKSKTRIREQWE